MTITGPDISRLAKRMSSQSYVLQMASWETLHVLKEVLVKLTLGWSMLEVQLFAAKIRDEFILGSKCTAILWHGGAFKVLCVVTGPKRGVVLESQGTTAIIPPYPSQWWGDTSSVRGESWQHGWGFPGGSKQHSRIKSKGCPPRTVQDQGKAWWQVPIRTAEHCQGQKHA
jgi:hypothetical protein